MFLQYFSGIWLIDAMEDHCSTVLSLFRLADVRCITFVPSSFLLPVAMASNLLAMASTKSRNLGTVYNQLREHDKAKVYFDAAAELVGHWDSVRSMTCDPRNQRIHVYLLKVGLQGRVPPQFRCPYSPFGGDLNPPHVGYGNQCVHPRLFCQTSFRTSFCKTPFCKISFCKTAHLRVAETPFCETASSRIPFARPLLRDFLLEPPSARPSVRDALVDSCLLSFLPGFQGMSCN